jgi:hypothetical protein
MNQIPAVFAEHFQPWHIVLPADALETQHAGEIAEQGWLIQYLFGHDERGSYLDYYAQHRMTNARHVRIYESGTTEDLPSEQEFIVYPANATPEEMEQIQQEYYAYNRRVGEELRRKGFH